MRRLLLLTAAAVGLTTGLSDIVSRTRGAVAATLSSVAEDVTVPFGGATMTIKRIEVAGSGSSAGDVAALLDRSNPKPLVEQLRGFASPAVVMPELIVEIPLGGVTFRAVVRDVRLVEIVGGRIGAASVGRTTLAFRGEHISERGDIGGMTARGIDVVQFARVFNDPRAPAGEPPSPLLTHLAIDGVDVPVADNLRLAAGRMSLSGLVARPLTVPLGSLAGRLASLENGSQPRREKEKAEILIAEDVAASFGIGSFEVRDFKASNPLGSEGFSFARIALHDLADYRLGEITAEGFSFPEAGRQASPPPLPNPSRSAAAVSQPFLNSAFTLVSVRGLDFRPGVDGLNAILDAAGQADGSLFRTAFPIFERALLLGLHVDLPDYRAPADRRARLDLEHFEIAGSNFTHGLPGALLIVLQGLNVDAAFIDAFGTQPKLSDVGLNGLEVRSARLDLGWNEATREIGLKALSANVAGLGAVTMTAIVGNASPDLFSSNPLVEQAAGLATVFKSADLSFTDAGMNDKIVALVAKQGSASAAETRAKLVEQAAVSLPPQLGGGRAAKAIGNALAKFIAQPQNLHLSAASASGLGFPDVVSADGPGPLLDRLEVSAAANE